LQVLTPIYITSHCTSPFNLAIDDEFKGIFNTPPLPESEDCLYLNIFTPSTIPPNGLPVLFWIHGGSFALGSGRIRDYDGSSIAANQGVVVVTINYRTNGTDFVSTASDTSG
jgi:carboxylesterase type B